MHMSRLTLAIVFVWIAACCIRPAAAQEVIVDAPNLVLKDNPFEVTFVLPEGDPLDAEHLQLRVGNRLYPVRYDADESRFSAGDIGVPTSGRFQILLENNGQVLGAATSRAIPGWATILPPVFAIVIALIFKRVIPALFFGIWLGAMAAIGFNPSGAWKGLLDAFQVYVLGALADTDRASVILFSLMIGGMVGIISKNGGMLGVVNKIVGWANSQRRGQLATSFLGLAIFFDDYANTLVVGNTMRPVTDRLRISREKLAYIVDSTAAPIACLALVTTWIGYEVGLIGTAVAQIDGFDEGAYSIFLSAIPYNFYPLLAILFVLAVAFSGRDFGPMLKAEIRAGTTGSLLSPTAQVDEAAVDSKELEPFPNKPQRAINAVLPVAVLVVGVLGSLYATGEGDTLRDIVGSADSYKALMWASLLGVLTAAILSIGQRILTVDETVEAWFAGLKSMMFAMIILVLAWALSSITETLGTADFLVTIMGDALPAALLPTLIFILSAVTAFATGTSWGTMGILMPLVVPLTWAVVMTDGLAVPGDYHIMYSSIACVLAGSVWGDHCSPISDTTILSSMASGCDHIDHVNTQLPYAMTVGVSAILFGTLPAGFGVPWWICLLLGAAVLIGILYVFGKPSSSDEIQLAEADASTTS